ncbi:peptide chain release factor N(5)-glutamine methyltransferase [Futiania mangrovi]|uniref:Release factor glutamine methyltransferase n=1 Tax=Futiania mangrovi TaxID=2959716 RepID=A0A9J6PAM2_9PROT|nr:peptide chain release factor N(5)-glutamine methyltransferase [Futiania mangrovii]MCP1336133.1 peptide chain release factor N(5)-glutamine methyltransferase [Futiania mangrovii]
MPPEEDPVRACPETVGAALAWARTRLRAAGVPDAGVDARVLLRGVTDLDAAAIIARPEQALDPEARTRYADAIGRRETREPVAHILGVREFWGLMLEVSPATLIPRPDTETLVEAALARVTDRRARLRVLDLGTGTGAILLALLHEMPRAEGLGTDVSADAVALARRNAARHGLGPRARFAVADWFDGLDGTFDLIVSNPPYIAGGDIAGLEPDVAVHEPAAALDGGTDGLDAYRRIALAALGHLAPAGTLLVEIGEGQAPAVTEIFAAAGLETVAIAADLAGIDRVIAARAKKELGNPCMPR